MIAISSSGGIFLEVDISKKAGYFIKYGFLGLVVLAGLCSGAVWWYHHNHAYITVNDAAVTSSMVGVKTRAAGTLEEIVVADGEHVEAGAVIAKIKVDVTPDQIQQLEQTVALAQQNLDMIKAGTTVTQPVTASRSTGSGASAAAIGQAADRLQRMEQLYAMGAVSAMERDAAQAAYDSLQSAPAERPAVSYQTIVQPSSQEAIHGAEVQLRQAQNALEAAKSDAQATDIVAPLAGTVYYADIKAGDEVKAGQTLLNIGNGDDIWIEAYVPVEQQEKLHLGQFVKYDVAGKSLQGTVLDIADPQAEKTVKEADGATEGQRADNAKAGKLTVKISVPRDSMQGIKPGTRAAVQFAR